MLSQYNAVDLERILRSTPAEPPFPPASDRPAWEAIRNKIGPQRTDRFIRKAEESAAEPIPNMPASMYLECKRTGRREGFEDLIGARQTVLRDLMTAECLEYQGRFLDPLMDIIWAICEESSWAMPAHQFELADIQRPYIDLNAVYNGLALAEVDLLLGHVLDPLVGKRIRDEVNRRLFEPYLARHDWWWLYNNMSRKTNNWNAVCNGCLMGAALYLEKDPARLADILAKGLRSLDDYLATFDADGGSSEGPGYWSYGFGNYTVIAHLLEQRTAGKVRLLDGDLLYKVAQFPLRTALSQQVWVNFSDAPRYAQFLPWQLAYLSTRLDLPELMHLAQLQPAFEDDGEPVRRLRELAWDLPEPSEEPFIPAKHDWFGEMMWMFSRYDPLNPESLVLAAKGGNNEEMHNQNDVGSFIVHFRQESLIADIGCGRYTRQYFGPERYEHLATSSLGHSVPLPNDCLQNPGMEYAARLLEHAYGEREDVLHLDLMDAYPASAGLAALERRLVFHREAPHGWVELEDSFAFASGPAPFETALTTFEKFEVGDTAVVIHGLRGKLRVGFDPLAVVVQTELYHDVDLADGLRDVYRITFSPEIQVAEGKIRLEIVPVD